MTTTTTTPALGTLRLYWHTNVPSKPKYYPVFTFNEACRLIEAIANEQLSNPDVSSNMCGLEKFVGEQSYETDHGWEDWEDDNGTGISAFMDEHDENKPWMTEP